MIKKAKLLALILAALILATGLIVLYFVNQQNGNNSTIRVACVGDSITYGTEYPNDLKIILGANYTVGNFGVGGSTVSLASEKPYMNQIEFQNAQHFQPNIVVILLGTNDAYPSRQQNLPTFEDDYRKLIASFQGLQTTPEVILVVPPPIFSASLGPNNTILLDYVIPRITQASTELGLPMVDIYTPLVNHSDYFWDGVHPNNSGAKVIAAKIYEAITG